MLRRISAIPTAAVATVAAAPMRLASSKGHHKQPDDAESHAARVKAELMERHSKKDYAARSQQKDHHGRRRSEAPKEEAGKQHRDDNRAGMQKHSNKKVGADGKQWHEGFH